MFTVCISKLISLFSINPQLMLNARAHSSSGERLLARTRTSSSPSFHSVGKSTSDVAHTQRMPSEIITTPPPYKMESASTKSSLETPTLSPSSALSSDTYGPETPITPDGNGKVPSYSPTKPGRSPIRRGASLSALKKTPGGAAPSSPTHTRTSVSNRSVHNLPIRSNP